MKKFDTLWNKSTEVCAMVYKKSFTRNYPIHTTSVRELKLTQKKIKCTIATKADFHKGLLKILLVWNPNYKYKRFGILAHELGHVAIWLHHQGVGDECACETIEIIANMYKKWILEDTSFKRKGAK